MLPILILMILETFINIRFQHLSPNSVIKEILVQRAGVGSEIEKQSTVDGPSGIFLIK